MHGGKSKGAPKGNRNAWVHGNRSAETEEQLKLLKATNAFLKSLKSGLSSQDQILEEFNSLLNRQVEPSLLDDPEVEPES